MYFNAGGKIKGLATLFAIMGFCVSFACAIIASLALYKSLGETVAAIVFVLTIVIGYIVSWLAYLLLYGYGQLIENSDKLVKIAEEEQEKNSHIIELLAKATDSQEDTKIV